MTRLGFDGRRLALALALLLPASALGWSGGVTPPGGGGDAAAITYTPDDGGNWTDPDPTTVGAALDALAAAAGGVITAALQDLDDLGVVAAADRWIYSTGAGVWAYGIVTAAGRALLDDANAVAQLATLGLPLEFRVCSTCAYTTIQAAMTAAGAAGGGVVRVAPGTYSETVTAASGVSMVCGAGGVAGSTTKRCRIDGTAGNPALVIDVGVPGEARENHVFAADGFLLSGGAGVGVGAVSFECPVAAAQRAELSNVSMVTGASGNALRVTCGAVGSGGLLSSLRLHGDYVEAWSQGSTEATVYHSAGYLDWRGRAVISATSADDVAFEIPAAAAGAVTVWWFEIIGRVTVAATSTATLTLGQGIITTATSAPITTNGSGATTLGVVGLYAAGASPAGGCVQGAGLLAHTPSALQNIGNCGTLIAATVNGGAGPDAGALQSRFESTVAPATYQPISAALQDIDDLGVVAAADKFIYSTGAGVWAYGDITGAARGLLDDETTGVMRATLGLGALATGSDSDDVGFSALDASWPDPDPTTVEGALAACGSRLTTLEAATVDAGDVTFTPGTVGDWTGDADPGDVDEALDDLAGRVETLEGVGGGESLVVFHPSSAAAAATGRIDVDNTTGITGDRLIITGPTGTVLRIGWENSAAPFPGDADVLLVSLPSSVNTNAGYIMRAINQTADAKIVWGPGGEIDVGITASQASPFSQDFVLLEADSNSDNNTPITSTHGGFTLQGMSGGSAGVNTYAVASGVTTVVVDTTLSDTGTVTLPAAEDGRAVTVSTLPGLPGGVTVDGAGAEVVDGQATVSVRGYGGGFKFLSDGTEWYSVLSRGKRGAWDWTQDVEAPSAADWTDASSAGADVSLSTLANCSTGSCVRMVPGASTTDRYGATVPIGAGDFTWCGLLGVVTAGVASHGTAQSGAVGFAFVDGTDVDTDSHYGIHSVAATDDFASRLLYVNDSNGGGTDEWDAAWTPDANNGYPVMRLEACFSRVGTTLSIYFSPTGAGWVRGVSYTVSADAGLMAVVIDEDDANTDEAVVYSYGDPGGLPWQ